MSPHDMSTNIVQRIARAFASRDAVAGRTDLNRPEPVDDRAANLVRCGYIVAGDPYGWSGIGGEPVATIIAEQKGGADDCVPPADYYGRWPEIGSALPGYWWEWENAAVGLVWHED